MMQPRTAPQGEGSLSPLVQLVRKSIALVLQLTLKTRLITTLMHSLLHFRLRTQWLAYCGIYTIDFTIIYIMEATKSMKETVMT